MKLTHHPFQRAGAHAAALIAGCTNPADLTDDHLNAVVDRITTDAAMAGYAEKDGPGWAWTQKLTAMYPSAPPTHPSRHKHGHDLEAAVRTLFRPDNPDQSEPCWTCGALASERWGKSLWPLLESTRYVNTSHDGRGGKPCCRECRIAVWCLPYATAYRAGAVATLDQTSSVLEEAWARSCVEESLRATSERWTAWPAEPGPMDRLVTLLDEHPDGVTLVRWKNGNQKQWLETTEVAKQDALWLSTARARSYAWHLDTLAAHAGTSVLALAAGGEQSIARVVGNLLDTLPATEAVHVSLAFSRLTFASARADNLDAMISELPVHSGVTARECALRWQISPARARHILAPLTPQGRDTATGAMLYDQDEAEAARAAMPGQGRRTDLKTRD